MGGTPRVREGDLVLIYLDDKRRFVRRVRKGAVLHTDRGALELGELVGKPIGYGVTLPSGATAYVLDPLPPDLMDLAFRRVSQVIYPKDLGYMLVASGIASGSRVLEGGVGSGCLATVLSLASAPEGCYLGLEVREDMLAAARRNLSLVGAHAFANIVQGDARHMPVRSGFFDAVFFDIPDPWNALEGAYECLRGGGVFTAFLPTVNQVEKLVLAVRRHGGFVDVKAVEVLVREYEVKEGATRPATRMIGHTGFIVRARKVLKDIMY